MKQQLAALFAVVLVFGAGSAGAASKGMDRIASDYPTKPVRMLIGFPPGGGNDAMARTIGPKLADKFGRGMVIDNRPGAGGNLAADLTAKAPADGYTILLVSSSHPIQGLLKKNLPYDPYKDFAGVAQLVVYRSLLVVHPRQSMTTIQNVIDLARAKPGQLNFASSGNGTGSHLAGELFRVAANVNMTHVPYKGGGQAVLDLLAGRVEMMFSPLVPVYPQIKAQRLRPIAVTSNNRSRLLPELPTIAESGVQGYEFVSWYAVLAPAGTPKAIVAKLNAAINEALRLPDVTEKLQGQDMDIINSTPQRFDGVRAALLKKWEKIVKQTGIQAD